jgi:ketosteroid isomerase-like protein
VTDIPVTAAYFRALNEQDREQFAACFTEQCELHSPFGSPPVQGRDQVEAGFDSLTNARRSVKIIPKSAYRSGDRIAVLWMADSVNGNGCQPCYEGVSVFEIDGTGRISRLEEYWDARAVEREIAEN